MLRYSAAIGRGPAQSSGGSSSFRLGKKTAQPSVTTENADSIMVTAATAAGAIIQDRDHRRGRRRPQEADKKPHRVNAGAQVRGDVAGGHRLVDRDLTEDRGRHRPDSGSTIQPWAKDKPTSPGPAPG